jgi:hypothetical protein
MEDGMLDWPPKIPIVINLNLRSMAPETEIITQITYEYCRTVIQETWLFRTVASEREKSPPFPARSKNSKRYGNRKISSRATVKLPIAQHTGVEIA